MAYTIERLKRVSNTFVRPQSKEKELRVPTLEELLGPAPYYDFRPRGKHSNSRLAVPCMDNDETKDYDPDEDLNPRKRKLSSNPRNRASSRAPKKAGTTSSEALAALQRSLIEEALREQHLREEYLSSAPFDYNFRSRERPSESSENVIDHDEMAAISGPSAQKGSSASPSPKACLPCQELELQCTLEKHPLFYPCANCRADKLDCVLSPPPTWKRPCEKCKSRRQGQRCSYCSGDYDHSKPCQFCQEHGFKCVAGPARHSPSAAHTDGIDAWTTHLTQSTQSTIFTPEIVALDDSSCSTSVDLGDPVEPAPTYELVTMVGPGLPPVLTIAADSNNSSKVTSSDDSSGQSGRSSPVELGETEAPLLEHQAAQLPGKGLPSRILHTITHYPGYAAWDEPKPYFVRTELPHPLKVMHDPSPPESEPCHWCHNFAYGITGLGVRYPKVLERGDGELIELQDGHANEGKEPSRMCIQCTSKRVRIILCSHDKIAPLVDHSSTELDMDAAFDGLAKASLALNTKSDASQAFPEPDHPWCNLCQSPAFWRCDSRHPHSRDEAFGGSTIPSDPGCGLHLCDYCAYYTIKFHGDLDAVFAHGKKDSENDTDFRADVNYILKRSENNVFWQQVHGKE